MAEFRIHLSNDLKKNEKTINLVSAMMENFEDLKVHFYLDVETDNQTLIPMLYILALESTDKGNIGDDEDLLGMGVS